jgi:hypothetical protein
LIDDPPANSHGFCNRLQSMNGAHQHFHPTYMLKCQGDADFT